MTLLKPLNNPSLLLPYEQYYIQSLHQAACKLVDSPLIVVRDVEVSGWFRQSDETTQRPPHPAPQKVGNLHATHAIYRMYARPVAA